jgi:hypothetical protein
MDSARHRRSVNIAALCGGVLLTVVACADSDRESKAPLPRFPNDHLVGSWDASFHRGDPLPSSSGVPEVHGTLTFAGPESENASQAVPASPVNYGLYDIDFSPYGFDSRDNGSVPGAVAHIFSLGSGDTDSVSIVLEPAQREVNIVLRGELRGDVARGAWATESPRRAGITEWGSFTLTRHRGSSRLESAIYSR